MKITKSFFLLISFSFLLLSCASSNQKQYNGPRSINIPTSKFKVKIKNSELNFLNKRTDVGFEQMYLEEGKGLRFFKIRSTALNKDLRALAYLKPKEVYNGLGIEIPVTSDGKINCYFNTIPEQRKSIKEQIIDFFASRGYKIYLNIDKKRKTSSYQEYILYKVSGRKKTFGMFLSKFRVYPSKSGKKVSLFCTHDGAGMRNTMSTIMRHLSKQF